MKKSLCFLGFFLVLCFYLALPSYRKKERVMAYETVLGALQYSTSFDETGTKAAIINEGYGDLVVRSNDASLVSEVDCDNYNAYIFDGVRKVLASCYDPGSYVSMWILTGYEDTGDYSIAGYLEPISGAGTTYFITGMTIQVYEEETVTDTSWFGDMRTYSNDIYTSPDIVSPLGRTIAGMKAKVDSFERGGQEMAGVSVCTGSDYECGYFEWLPFPFDKRIWGDVGFEETPFVFMGGGEQDSVSFRVTTDQRGGCGGKCYVDHEIGSESNIILYTRDPVSPPPPPPPPQPDPPCSTVYGYVQTQEGVGITGATIDINTVDSDTCSGGQAGYGDPVSGTDGYWEASNSINMECLRVAESNATGYIDDGSPDVPVGADVWNDNLAMWPNPPTGNCGPFTFYDILDCVSGIPAKIEIVSPDGTAGDPDVIIGVDNTALDWEQDSSGLADLYRVRAWDSIGTTMVNAIVVGLANVSYTESPSPFDYDGLYYWQVQGVNQDKESCSAEYGPWSDQGYFIFNGVPSFDSFLLKNSNSTNVNVETGDRNHICQSEFLGDRRTVMSVIISDEEGGDTVDEVRFRLRAGGVSSLVVRARSLSGTPVSSLWGSDAGNVILWGSEVTTSVSGSDRTVNFYIEFESGFSADIYDMGVYAADSLGSTLPWTDVGRDFKMWDCQVGVSGTLYDGTSSDVGIVCPLAGFDNEAETEMNFTGLVFGGLDGADDETMAVTSPSYVDGGNKLMWSSSYTRVFNADLTGSIPIMRISSAGDGNKCGSLAVDSDIVSAYDNPPVLDIDFSSVLDQEAWFQIVGAGMGAKTSVLNRVPYTCVTDPLGVCRAAITVDVEVLGVGQSDNGLVSAAAVINDSTCSEDDCPYGDPNNWSLEEDVMGESCAYQDFYNKYYEREGFGTVYGGDVTMDRIATDTGGTGVVFVNGDVDIDENSIVDPGDFLMIIASRSISIDSGVNQVDGLLVADGGVGVGGTSVDQLVINGSLCSAKGSVSLNRGYTNESDNNTSPATVINFRPDFIFNMPGELTKVLSGWREGN